MEQTCNNPILSIMLVFLMLVWYVEGSWGIVELGWYCIWVSCADVALIEVLFYECGIFEGGLFGQVYYLSGPCVRMFDLNGLDSC